MASASQLLKKLSEITKLERINPEKDQVNPEENTHPWSWFPDESLAKPQDTEAHSIQVSNQARNLSEEMCNLSH